MAFPESQAVRGEVPEHGYIGRIPVRNLWLLMLYASELFEVCGTDATGLEEAPDEIPELIAEILAHAVEERQRRRLNQSYRTRTAPLCRVRGRIDVLATERHQLLARGLVACKFNELTIDTPRNRYVRAALESISRQVRTAKLAHRCRKFANEMKLMGVSGSPPALRKISADRIGRNDSDDRYMIAAAKLVFEISLPTESSGTEVLPLPEREERWARRLFERAVGGFYKTVLSSLGWRVRSGSTLSWQIDSKSAGIDNILPRMQTDIVLDHLETGRRIIVDTKFNAVLQRGHHREKSLRSGYLYQIYAYLRSQAGKGDAKADRAKGILLHPSVGESVDETVIIQGHRFRFMTVDLTANTAAIRRELLNVANCPDLEFGTDSA